MDEPLFSNVIVGVDFSESSKALMQQARRMAQQFGARLSLLHAATEPLPIAGPEGLPVPLPQPVDTKGLAESLRDFYGVRDLQDVDVVVQIGYPSDVIRAYAESVRKPLIVIGASDRGVFSRLIRGSHAEEITTSFIRDSEIPILVMKQTA